MKVYDISMNIEEEMMVYKNKKEKRPKITVPRDHSNSSVYESMLTMELHTGTHIDAPLHIIENGATIDGYDVKNFVQKCKVLDFTKEEKEITKEVLQQKKIQKGDFILLKTRNSFVDEFDFEFVYLEKGGAAYLKEQKIIGVGTDALGIERSQPDHETHKILLNAGVIIIEGLRLKDVEEGEYMLYAPPLKIKGVEASPTRALLIGEDSE